MKCPYCKKETVDNQNFCKFCGNRITGQKNIHAVPVKRCKQCKAILREGARFCSQCSAPILPEEVPGGTETPKGNKVLKMRIFVFTLIFLGLVVVLADYYLDIKGRISNAIQSIINKEKEETIDDPNTEEITNRIDQYVHSVDRSIQQNKCDPVTMGEDMIAYGEGDDLLCIFSFKNDSGGYDKKYYYDENHIVYAEYAGNDINKFYFENEELIRWTYYRDANDLNNMVNHDQESSDTYSEWVTWFRTSSQENLNMWNQYKKNSQKSGEAAEPQTQTTYVLPTSEPDSYYYYNNHTYAFYDASRYGFNSYQEVVDFCRKQGGHLAVINDADENKYLFNSLKQRQNNTAFFGYSDEDSEGYWKWSDADSAFENWTRYGSWELPDNGITYGGNEDYAEFNYDGRKSEIPNDGTWNDAPFRDNTDTFICEWDFDMREAIQ